MKTQHWVLLLTRFQPRVFNRHRRLSGSFNSPIESPGPETAKKLSKIARKTGVHILSVSHPDNQVTPGFCWQEIDVLTAAFEAIMDITFNGKEVELTNFFKNNNFFTPVMKADTSHRGALSTNCAFVDKSNAPRRP